MRRIKLNIRSHEYFVQRNTLIEKYFICLFYLVLRNYKAPTTKNGFIVLSWTSC